MPDPSPLTLSLNSNFLQLGRRSGGRPQRTIYPRRLPVNCETHCVSGNRTHNLPIVNPTRYQLCYRGCVVVSMTSSRCLPRRVASSVAWARRAVVAVVKTEPPSLYWGRTEWDPQLSTARLRRSTRFTLIVVTPGSVITSSPVFSSLLTCRDVTCTTAVSFWSTMVRTPNWPERVYERLVLGRYVGVERLTVELYTETCTNPLWVVISPPVDLIKHVSLSFVYMYFVSLF